MTTERLIRKAKNHWISALLAEKDGSIQEAIYHCGLATGLLLAIDETEKEQNKIAIADVMRAVCIVGERLK